MPREKETEEIKSRDKATTKALDTIPKIYHAIGEINGVLKSQDERMTRIEEDQRTMSNAIISLVKNGDVTKDKISSLEKEVEPISLARRVLGNHKLVKIIIYALVVIISAVAGVIIDRGIIF